MGSLAAVYRAYKGPNASLDIQSIGKLGAIFSHRDLTPFASRVSSLGLKGKIAGAISYAADWVNDFWRIGYAIETACSSCADP